MYSSAEEPKRGKETGIEGDQESKVNIVGHRVRYTHEVVQHSSVDPRLHVRSLRRWSDDRARPNGLFFIFLVDRKQYVQCTLPSAVYLKLEDKWLPSNNKEVNMYILGQLLRGFRTRHFNIKHILMMHIYHYCCCRLCFVFRQHSIIWEATTFWSRAEDPSRKSRSRLESQHVTPVSAGVVVPNATPRFENKTAKEFVRCAVFSSLPSAINTCETLYRQTRVLCVTSPNTAL